MSLVTDPELIKILENPTYNLGTEESPFTEGGSGEEGGEEASMWSAAKKRMSAMESSLVATQVSPELSDYAKRKARNDYETWKEEDDRLSTLGKVGSGLMFAAPAIAASVGAAALTGGAAIPAMAAGGIVSGLQGTGEALLAQQEANQELDINKAAKAGLATGVTDAALTGVGQAAKVAFAGAKAGLPAAKPWVARGIDVAEDTLSNASSKVYENLAAGKNWEDGVVEAGAFGAVGGQAIRGSIGAMQRTLKTAMNDGGAAAVKGLVGLQEKKFNVNKDFSDNAYGYANQMKELDDQIANTPIDQPDRIRELVNAKASLAESSGDSAILTGFELADKYNVPLTDVGLDINISRNLDGSDEINVAGALGRTAKDIDRASKITQNAQTTQTRFGNKQKINEEGVTTESFFKQFKDAVLGPKGALGDIRGNVFGKNLRTVAEALETVKRNTPEDRAKIQLLTDLKNDIGSYNKAVERSLQATPENISEELSSLGRRIMTGMAETGLGKNLVGIKGDVGAFDPIRDARALQALMQMAERQMPGIHQRTPKPDEEKATGMLTPGRVGAMAAGMMGGGHMGAGAVATALKGADIIGGMRSRQNLRGVKKASAERIQGLINDPRRKLDAAIKSGDSGAAAKAAGEDLESMGISTGTMNEPVSTSQERVREARSRDVEEALTPVAEPTVSTPEIKQAPAPTVVREPLPTKLKARSKTDIAVEKGEAQRAADQQKAFEESEKMAAEEIRKQAQAKRDAEALRPAPKKSRAQRKAEREAKSRQKAEEIRKQRQEEANAKVEDFSQKAEPVKEAPKAKITAAKPKPKAEPEAVVETVPVAPKAPGKASEGMTGKPKQPQAEAPESAPKASESPSTAKEQEAYSGAKEAAKTWDKAHRSDRAETWIFSAETDDATRAGFKEALDAGGDNIPAHGMAKESTLTGAIDSLFGMLKNGLDPKRGGGELHIAPLVNKPGEGQVGFTASGGAYKDGPFILVAKRDSGLTGNLEGLRAVLVNQEHADILPQLRSMVQSVRPDVDVELYSGAGKLVKKMNSEISSTPSHAKEAAKTRKAPLPRKPQTNAGEQLRADLEAKTKTAPKVSEPEKFDAYRKAKQDLQDLETVVKKLSNIPTNEVEDAILQMGGMSGVRAYQKELGGKVGLDATVRKWIANRDKDSIKAVTEKLNKQKSDDVKAKAKAAEDLAVKRMTDAENVFKAKDVPDEVIKEAKEYANGDLAVFKARVGQLLKNAAETKKTRSDNAKKAAKTKLKNAEDMRKRAEETFTSRSYAEKYVKGLGVSDSRITDLLNNTYGNPKAKIPKKVSVNQVNDLMNKIDNLLDQDLKAYQGLVKKGQDPTGEVAAKIKALTERKAQMQALKAEQEKAIADAKAASREAAEADLKAQRLADEAEAEVKAAEEQIASRKKLDNQLKEMTEELKIQGASDDFIQEHVYMTFFKEDKPLTDKAFATARKKATKDLQKHADKVALENQKAAEEILGELSGSALSESAKGIVLKAAGATGEEAAEQRGVTQALEKVLKEKGVDEVAEYVSVFNDIVKKAEDRRANFPNEPTLWISEDDITKLQDLMSKKEGSSYTGNLYKRLRLSMFGDKETLHLVRYTDKELTERMKMDLDEDIKIKH